MPKSLRDYNLVEQLNFILTNRIPRRLMTRFMGRMSRIEQPLFTRSAMWIWQRFAGDLDLTEAIEENFRSIHECFTRQLKPGMREIDCRDEMITSPSDGIVGAHGKIADLTVLQAKGYPYELSDLIPDPDVLEKYRNGRYMTLRLTSTMYHRFHAPVDCSLKRIIFIPGDTWNVNPPAVRKIEKLFCKNERAVLDLELGRSDHHIAVIPVAAITVASLKLHALEDDLDMHYTGPTDVSCDVSYDKGEELGYFQHGSTIILLASEKFEIHPDIFPNQVVRMGQPIFVDTQSFTRN